MDEPLFIGIDGGGSKVEFVVADATQRILKEVRIEQGSNPWVVGADATCSVLERGLDQCAEYMPRVQGIVAGIGGQFNKNQYTAPIEATLKRYSEHALLVGDLPIAFRSQSPVQQGIIAIAGTGSSAVQFYGDGSHYLYDGVGVGGRDLGYLLAQAYARDGVLSEQARQFLLALAPSLGDGSRHTTGDYYADTSLKDIVKNLPASPEDALFAMFRPWLDVAADRWKFKLYGIVKKYMEHESCAPSDVVVVLSGGLWRNAYILNTVRAQLAADHPGVTVYADSNARPVMGAVRMAIEMVQG